jgi:hypothetical protein
MTDRTPFFREYPSDRRPIRAAQTAEAEAFSMMETGRVATAAATLLIWRGFLPLSPGDAAAKVCQETFRKYPQKSAIPKCTAPRRSTPDLPRFRFSPQIPRNLARSGVTTIAMIADDVAVLDFISFAPQIGGFLDFPPWSGGVRSERHAAARMVIPSMLARASAGVR